MRDIWSASQGVVPRSSTSWNPDVSNILESCSFTLGDRYRLWQASYGDETLEWNEECRTNGGKCHLPISLLTTYFTLDHSS